VGGDDIDAQKDVYRRKVLDGTNAFPTDLISMASGFSSGAANKGNATSEKPCVSSDGRYVAFESSASNLVTSTADGGPDLNATFDVFVRDAQTFRTVRCSVPKAGAPQPDPPPVGADGPSQSATISGDGQIVVFRSTAANLHPDDDGATSDIFLRQWNLAIPTTEILSVHTSGAQAGSSCDNPSISSDGTKITWVSSSSNLVNGDSNAQADVFLRNRSDLTTTRISVSTFGNELNALSGIPRISADGRYVVFYTEATNAADDDINGAADIFLRGPPF
jgi:Tol biopolymer transport system component